jgi:hypothetical protein
MVDTYSNGRSWGAKKWFPNKSVNFEVELFRITPAFGEFLKYLEEKSFGTVSITDEEATKTICFRTNRMPKSFIESIIVPWITEHFGPEREVTIVRSQAGKIDFEIALTTLETKTLNFLRLSSEQ